MSKGAGNAIGVVAVLGVGYLAWKNGALDGLKKLFTGTAAASNYPANVPAAFKFNATNSDQSDALAYDIRAAAARLSAPDPTPPSNVSLPSSNGADLATVLQRQFQVPLLVTAPTGVDTNDGWSRESGNYEQ